MLRNNSELPVHFFNQHSRATIVIIEATTRSMINVQQTTIEEKDDEVGDLLYFIQVDAEALIATTSGPGSDST